jgi:surface polysaccharide O-acyltransferase-like enzyme
MKERNYSLDLYRIICMFLITTIHIFGYSNIMDSVSYTDFNFYFINFIKTLQSFSINGFVLISAYFLVNNKVSINSTVKRSGRSKQERAKVSKNS